jgi:hypothetical protein
MQGAKYFPSCETYALIISHRERKVAAPSVLKDQFSNKRPLKRSRRRRATAFIKKNVHIKRIHTLKKVRF